MWEIIAAFILCLFSIVGFVASIKTLIFKICKPKNENAYIVINTNKNTEDLEYTLRSWSQRIKWLKGTAPNGIIIIDNGLNKESREICRLMCKESELFKLCTPVELYKIFR